MGLFCLGVHAASLESPCPPLHGLSAEVGCTSPGAGAENIEEEEYVCEGFGCAAYLQRAWASFLLSGLWEGPFCLSTGARGPSPSRLRCQHCRCVQAAEPGHAADPAPVWAKLWVLPGSACRCLQVLGREKPLGPEHGCWHMGRPAQAGWWQGRAPPKRADSVEPARLVGRCWFDQRKWFR